MYKVVDSHINAVNLIITLPSLEDIEKEKCEKKVVEEAGDPFDKSADESGSSPEETEKSINVNWLTNFVYLTSRFIQPVYQ